MGPGKPGPNYVENSMARLTKEEKLPVKVELFREPLDGGDFNLGDLVKTYGPDYILRYEYIDYEPGALYVVLERDETPEEYATRLDDMLAAKTQRAKEKKAWMLRGRKLLDGIASKSTP